VKSDDRAFSPRACPVIRTEAKTAAGTSATPGAELVSEIRRRLSRVGWITDAVGTALVFCAVGFMIPIFIDPGQSAYLARLNVPAIAVYFAVVGVAVTRYTSAYIARTLAWLAEGRPPNEHEHRKTLGLAAHLTKVAGLAWFTAVPLFAALNAVASSWGMAGIVAGTTWLGGEATCALAYLAYERTLRPVTALALEAGRGDGNAAPGVSARLAMAWTLGTGVPLLGVLVVGTAGLIKPGVHSEYIAAAALFLGVVAYAVGLMALLSAAKAIAHPVSSVRAGLERIERGDLDTRVRVDDSSEVGELQAGFNRMAEGLEERERIRDLFGRQVGEDVARAALRDGTRLGGEEREVGALFVDLIGSTSMALAMPPTEVVRLLNRFFRIVVEVVEAEGGFVNKFEGDAALCVFGAPVERPDPSADALRAARSLAARLSREIREVDYGIGVSGGIAVAGNVGAERRFEYTVIGDPVNEAARLSELAKQRPERVLASEAALTRAADAESDAWRVTESAMLRGRTHPTGVAHPRA
jgi:adenylate cyclase